MNISEYCMHSSKTRLFRHLVMRNFAVPVGFDWGYWNDMADEMSRSEIRETLKTVRMYESVRPASDCTKPTITTAKIHKYMTTER